MGQCIARRFADEGASVVVAGRHAEPLAQLASEIGGASRLCDFTRKEDIDALVAFARERYGRVDVGINATGWGLLRPFEDTSEEELHAIMGLQFKAPFQFMQALVKAMRENPTPGGSIIMISSATATIMLENHAAYMGTKAGTDHVVRCVANEFGQFGIRANSISPGITRTPMSGDALNIPRNIAGLRGLLSARTYWHCGRRRRSGAVVGKRSVLHDRTGPAGQWRPDATPQSDNHGNGRCLCPGYGAPVGRM